MQRKWPGGFYRELNAEIVLYFQVMSVIIATLIDCLLYSVYSTWHFVFLIVQNSRITTIYCENWDTERLSELSKMRQPMTWVTSIGILVCLIPKLVLITLNHPILRKNTFNV